jgi:S1-C subfamily serine protease
MLLTTYTVGGQASELTVRQEERRLPARRLAADPRSGIALLKVEGKTPALSSGSSRDLPVATPVVAIGYPLDLPLTPAFGTIAGFDLKYLGHHFGVGHLRANLTVQEGESGAPVVDMRGRLIGMLVSSMEAGSAAFIVPVEAAEKLRRDHARFGELRTAWLGINLRNNAGGAEISSIIEPSPAAAAGIQNGDQLLQVGPHLIHSVEDLLNASFYLSVDEPVAIRIARNQQTLELRLTPSAVPPPAAFSLPESGTPQPAGSQPGTVRGDRPR